MLPAFNLHIAGAKRALASGDAQGSQVLLRKALSVASRMQDGARKGLCLRILKWLRKGVQS